MMTSSNNDNQSQTKIEKVVGLKYDAEHGLPEVILKGAGELAQKIITEGERIHGRPFIVKDENLVEQLYKLPVESDIHPALFELVAAVLVHIYSVEEKRGEEQHGSD